MAKFQGRNSRAAKLTQAQVEEIRRRYSAGEASQGQLAREYFMSVVQIGRIVRNESWIQAAAAAPREADMDALLERLMNTQQEVTGVHPRSAADKMAEEIKKAKGPADEWLNELTGELSERPAEAK
jgi:hypothetical protein